MRFENILHVLDRRRHITGNICNKFALNLLTVINIRIFFVKILQREFNGNLFF